MNNYLYGIFLLVLICVQSSYSADSKNLQPDIQASKKHSFNPSKRPFSILLIEEGENSLGIYDSEKKKEVGRIRLTFFPHEIEVSGDGSTAYISNFGIRDYDVKIGHPGNSISIIDLINFCEVGRLYTTFQDKYYWGPHGLKLHPDGTKLYVNVECINGRYPTSNAPQPTMMLVFNLNNGQAESLLPPPPQMGESTVSSYPLLTGTHNFVFSPKASDPTKPNYRDLWYYSGVYGVTRINPETGEMLQHYSTNVEASTLPSSETFNGAVRGLSFNQDGTQLLVSATNEVAIISLSSDNRLTSIRKIGNLGVGQLFYSKFIPDSSFVLSPAARENQVLVIDTNPDTPEDKRIVQRIPTGIDPLQVVMSPIAGEKVAYVTNADCSWISELDLQKFTMRAKIPTKGGTNGIAFSSFFPNPPALKLKLGACLPLTGEYAPEGRECLLGILFWQEVINGAGGIVVSGVRYEIETLYEDTRSTTNNEELRDIVTQFIDHNSSRLKNEGILAMFGAFPPSANLTVAQVLNPRGLPLITSTGREPSLFSAGLKNVFGISPLRKTADLIGTFQAIYKHSNPKPRTAMILSCDLAESKEEALALTVYLASNGIKVLSPFAVDVKDTPSIITYKHCRAYQQSDELRELNEVMLKIASAARENCQFYPDLLFISGHRKESATIINACAQQDLTCGAIALNVGISSHFFLTQVTAPVENLLGTVCWSTNCCEFAQDRFVASSDFHRMFYDRYSEDPSDLITGFAATGIVIEEALKKCSDPSGGGDFANTTLIEKLRATKISSFYGPITFDPNGANTTKSMITVQLRTQDSKLQAISVWPSSIAGKEKPHLPYAKL